MYCAEYKFLEFDSIFKFLPRSAQLLKFMSSVYVANPVHFFAPLRLHAGSASRRKRVRGDGCSRVSGVPSGHSAAPVCGPRCGRLRRGAARRRLPPFPPPSRGPRRLLPPPRPGRGAFSRPPRCAACTGPQLWGPGLAELLRPCGHPRRPNLPHRNYADISYPAAGRILAGSTCSSRKTRWRLRRTA